MGISSNINGERLDMPGAGNNQPFIQFQPFNQSPVQVYVGPGTPGFNANAGSLYFDVLGHVWAYTGGYNGNNGLSWQQIWAPNQILTIPLPQAGVPHIQLGNNGNFLTQPGIYSGAGAPGNNQAAGLGSIWMSQAGHAYGFGNNGWTLIF